MHTFTNMPHTSAGLIPYVNVSVYRKLKCYLTSSATIPKPSGAVELAHSMLTFVSYFFPCAEQELEKEFVAITVCSRGVGVLLDRCV